eukprot:7384227-Prymnesium_polylepis.1
MPISRRLRAFPGALRQQQHPESARARRTCRKWNDGLVSRRAGSVRDVAQRTRRCACAVGAIARTSVMWQSVHAYETRRLAVFCVIRGGVCCTVRFRVIELRLGARVSCVCDLT